MSENRGRALHGHDRANEEKQGIIPFMKVFVDTNVIQYAAAQGAGAAYIVTRNKADFEISAIPCVSPAEFFALYNAVKKQ